MNDGQAQPGATRTGGSSVVEPGEALEDPATIRGIDTWAVVGDGHGHKTVIAGCDPNDDLTIGMPLSVVDQVGD
jgi:hypothetical protein